MSQLAPTVHEPVMPPRMAAGLAIALSTLAGFVDAIGYLSVGGLFVAFMSGNSTVLGIATSNGPAARVELAGGLVLAFLVGVMVGTWCGRLAGELRAPAVLVLVAGLLAVGAALEVGMGSTPAAVVMAVAMGAENTVFARHGQSGIGLTYMTGTLVRLGQRTAEAVLGGPWAPVLPDTLLWVGMVVGAAAGALVYDRAGVAGLWVAVVVALGMAGVAWWGLRR